MLYEAWLIASADTAGHSLGGAVALLDATMLKMQLPSTIQIITVTFGMPRVGNQKFANMVDRIVRINVTSSQSCTGSRTYQLPGVIRVTNQDDIVPIVPPQILDFRQVSGEIHVKSVNKNTGVASLVSCPGQENPVSIITLNILTVRFLAHLEH